MNKLSVIGIDIAKTVFHLHGADGKGKPVLRKRLNRGEVLSELANMECCTIVMEACGGASYLGRELRKLGFEVKLIAPQFVKPFVKSNKNDWKDAEAIVEAAQRPTMRFCEVKSVEQQELQHLHRIRERLVSQRTALGNELRGILMEYGITMPKGKKSLRTVHELLEKHAQRLTQVGHEMVIALLEEFWALDKKIAKLDKQLESFGEAHPICKRLQTIPGVGPIIATAIVAASPAPTAFKNGRQFAAWLGLVPKQSSTGGKSKLLGISKRGDSYIRKQLVHGARSLLYVAHKKTDRFSRWAFSVKERRGWNKASVAVANKNARIIWAVMRYEKDYFVATAV